MCINRIIVSLFSLLPLSVFAQVEPSVMQQIYEESRTPYKYGMVVAPSDNKHKYDCPTVFREGSKWYMTFVCYDGKSGNDGRGYETWLAESDDLLHWTIKERVLTFPTTNTWDANQRGGFPSLIDHRWGGTYQMQTWKGRHWMTYIGGPGKGYEAVEAPLSIGIASTKNDITMAHPWETYEAPIMSYNDKDAQWWEQLTQYKSTIYRLDKKIFGYPFVMYYNAGGKDATHPKGERIGIALSKDMKKWKRYAGNPVFAHDSDGTITGDAQLVEMNLPPFQRPVYVMYYFSAFNPTREYNAYNTFAASYDLVNWTDWEGDDLIIPSKPYDEMFAHKSCVVKWQDTVYHFYCAVNNAQQRGIAVATSKHLGKSEVSFPEPDPTGHRYTASLNDNWEITFDGKTMQRDVPVNLDDYYGYLQGEHGNLHGDAVFRKTFFAPDLQGKAYFIRFEGVGTYADITLNGKPLGRYDIGRTTETIIITDAVRKGGDNELVVKVSHPAGITDMPWVCGGCSSEWGFSEGSQPFGIYRPVVLEVTDEVRIEPFGVHVWSNVNTDSVFFDTEVKNYGQQTMTVDVISKLSAKDGKQVIRLTNSITLKGGEMKTIRQQSAITNPTLWSIEKPYLYRVNTIIKRNGKAVESTDIPFGFKTTTWPLTRKDGDKRFFLNGKPVFINGTCEYEHIFGQSHAFYPEQIAARVKMIKDAGFNAFRDAHQPHNLLYQQLFDEQGILWWPQFSAHIWYDTPQFRESFKRHLRQWIKERRNSPSIILWGLQNESTLPADFAEECSDIIREMDPGCGTQRLVTTCNGGVGTDWNVVQNWSGTYGGNVNNYGNELKRDDQLLNGEYGAWRTLGNHSSEGYTEEKFCQLMKTKILKAEEVRDSVCGQFQWVFATHDNPGRRQPDEALRLIDKVGPLNYKGLMTVWDQPTDGYYMYKDHYDHGYVAPEKSEIDAAVIQPAEGYHYLYTLNCGGDDYTDSYGRCWMQDNSQWSHSWGDRFERVSSYQTSQTFNDQLSMPLFKTSRFGRHELYYTLPAPKGDYRVELYFVEPWYRMDAEGFRIFDVAVNDQVVINDLDIWAQVHYGKPYKRVVDVHNDRDAIRISFPQVKAGQAMIAAIAVATKEDVVSRSKPNGSTMWADFEKQISVKMPDSMLPPKSSPALEVEGKMVKKQMVWDYQVGVAKVYALRWKYYNPEKVRKLHVKITDQNGVVFKDDDITFLQTDQKITKRKMTSITTGTMVNAGSYHVVVSGEGLDKMMFDALTVE